jgi:hypothetical protein
VITCDGVKLANFLTRRFPPAAAKMRVMASTSFGSTLKPEGELAVEAVVPYRISQLCTVDMAPLLYLCPWRIGDRCKAEYKRRRVFFSLSL